jgi:glycosyltransferase involved in cell wall biosynthesis
MKSIKIIKNQTVGGGDRYCNNVIAELKKNYKVQILSPESLRINSKSVIFSLWEYVKYVYFYLPHYYKKLGRSITNDKNNEIIIVFQDAYRKCPDIFQTLKLKSLYILHEPPREFYEPLNLHAPRLKDKIFTLIIRLPIYFIDRSNTKKASIIISNSKFSSENIKKIYKKKSKVIYPGLNIFSKERLVRQYQCISVGSLLPYKGHLTLIRAVSLISKKKPSIVIVGNGSEEQKNELLLEALKNNVKLKIISNITDRTLGSLYRKSSVYVNCAYKEPFGMTSLEGLGHGCSLVTTDRCGTEELKRFFPNNIFVSNGEINDISKKIELALNINMTKYDYSIFSWKKVASELIKTLIK